MNIIPFPKLKYGCVYGPKGERITPTRRTQRALERRAQRDAALAIARIRGWRAPPAIVLNLIQKVTP